MKITLDIPDGTLCAFVNYVFYRDLGLSLGTKGIATDDLYDGALIKVEPPKKEEAKDE